MVSATGAMKKNISKRFIKSAKARLPPLYAESSPKKASKHKAPRCAAIR